MRVNDEEGMDDAGDPEEQAQDNIDDALNRFGARETPQREAKE